MSRLTLIKLPCIVLLLIASFAVYAEPLIDGRPLKDMVKNIYRQPVASYEKIKGIEPKYAKMSFENKLWWLIRKAEAEFLLFYYPEFDRTVAQAQGLIAQNPTLPLSDEISITVNLFLGVIYQKQSLYAKSSETLQLALSQAQATKMTRLAIRAKQELAYTLSLTEHFEASLSDLQIAYIDAFSLDDDFLVATVNEVYGAIYGYMHEYEKSAKYYKKALKSYQVLGYPSYIAEAYNGLAATYRYWKKYDLAIDYYYKYREVISHYPNQEILFFADYGLGMSLAEKGDCQQAIEVIDSALNFSGLIDYDAELYKSKARCLISLSRLDEAWLALEQAENILEQLPELLNTRWQIEVIKIAAELAHAQGNDRKAYKLLNDYHQQTTALLKANSSERLAQLRTALELERQGIESSLLQHRAKVLELQVSQQAQRNEIQSYIIFFALLFVIFVIIISLIQHKSNQKIQALSIIEPVSNLFNRRYTFSYLTKLLAKSSDGKASVALLLIDIDNFKLINEQYGHPFADQVIIETVEIIKDVLRVEDVVGRISGEEFLCILTRLDINQVLVIAKRIHENIEQYNFVNETQGQINITVSIGVTIHTSGTTDSASLYAQANKALYQAKHRGKNRIIQYHSYMQSPLK